jgi:hypothetical protein
MEMKIWKHRDIDMRRGSVENGDMETSMHGDMDMET